MGLLGKFATNIEHVGFTNFNDPAVIDPSKDDMLVLDLRMPLQRDCALRIASYGNQVAVHCDWSLVGNGELDGHLLAITSV